MPIKNKKEDRIAVLGDDSIARVSPLHFVNASLPSSPLPSTTTKTLTAATTTATTMREVRAWYTIDWANSVYNTIAVSGFLPLLIQSCALEASGFPEICGNLIKNSTQISAIFAQNHTKIEAMYYLAGFPGVECDDPSFPQCIGGYCRGYPTVISQCRGADGVSPFPLRLPATTTDPTAYTTIAISASVAAQVVAFMCFAAMADYGAMRKKALLTTAVVGGLFTVLCAGITPVTWWLGLPLMLLSNVCFGLNSIMYNAYLPLLVRSHPLVTQCAADAGDDNNGGGGTDEGAATFRTGWSGDDSRYGQPDNTGNKYSEQGGRESAITKEVEHMADFVPHQDVNPGRPGTGETKAFLTELKLSNEWSNKGFAWGYVSGVLGIVLCAPFVFFMSEVGAYQVSMVIAGVWWIAFMYKPWKYLHVRPGAPLPAGRGYVTQSISSIMETARELWKLKTTLAYIGLWMLYSDAAFLIGNIGGLYANSEVQWGCLPKGIGILGMFLIVPIFAGIGNVAYLAICKRLNIGSQAALVFTIVLSSLVPAYGLIGFFSDTIGVRQGWEMLVVAVVYGFSIGPLQGYARSIFASLIPHGKEAAFYSIYELTNRGSSALGPLVLTAIQQATGELRYGFIFVLINLLLPAIALWFLDIEKGKVEAQRASKITTLEKSIELRGVGPTVV